MTGNTNGVFECPVCLDNKQEANPRFIEGSPVCAECVSDRVLPLFHLALEFEHAWPPAYGSAKLHIEYFADLLGKDFVARYHRREVEYKSKENRIYCRHMTYAIDAPSVGSLSVKGTRLALSPAQIALAREQRWHLVECGGLVSGRKHRQGTRLLCHRCNGYSCSCGAELASKDADHVCPPTQDTTPEERLTGQVKGRDYQLCPSCSIPVTLRDGCNHVVCSACQEGFCYVCGKRVAHTSDHWRQDCPRWNAPDSGQAVYDRPDVQPGLQPGVVGIMAFQADVNAQIVNGGRPDEAFFAEAIRELAAINIQVPDDFAAQMRQEAQPLLADDEALQTLRETLRRLARVEREVAAWIEREQRQDPIMLADVLASLLAMARSIADNELLLPNLQVLRNGVRGEDADPFLEHHRFITHTAARFQGLFDLGNFPHLAAMLEAYIRDAPVIVQG